jgi:hypothetical protein
MWGKKRDEELARLRVPPADTQARACGPGPNVAQPNGSKKGGTTRVQHATWQKN